MAVSKKEAQKINSKGKKDNARNMANGVLQSQGLATDKGKNPVVTQRGYAKSAEVAMKLTPKKTGAKSTGKVTTTLKRVNQSVVARGGRPGPTTPAKVQRKGNR
jgi:hypothetical protein